MQEESQTDRSPKSQLTLETRRYTGGKLLGEGTFGEVFLATRKDDGLQVAIKRLKDPCGNWNDVKGLRELIAMRNIPHHPCIVQPYEVIKGTQERLYLVFEYMPDDSLHELLYRAVDHDTKGPRRLDEGLLQTLLRQILSAVEHCHRHSFFHRDLKPENILLKRRRDAPGEMVCCKLADFSLARRFHRNPGSGHGHLQQQPSEPPTSYVSTRWYRAPEILLSSSQYSCPVDIFAVGCIMGEMYELKPIFPGDSEVDQIHKVFRFLGRPTPSNWPEGCALAQQVNIEWPAELAVGSLQGIRTIAAAARRQRTRMTTAHYGGGSTSIVTPSLVAAPTNNVSGNQAANIIERLSGVQKGAPVSGHALDIFCGLVEVNPNKRLTARNALSHPYFVEPLKSTRLPFARTSGGPTTTDSITSPKSVTEIPFPQPSPTFRVPRVATYQQEDIDLFCSP